MGVEEGRRRLNECKTLIQKLSVDNLRMTGRELSFRSQLELAAARRGANSFQEAEPARRGNPSLEAVARRGSASTVKEEPGAGKMWGEGRRGFEQIELNSINFLSFSEEHFVSWGAPGFLKLISFSEADLDAFIFWGAQVLWRVSSKKKVLSFLDWGHHPFELSCSLISHLWTGKAWNKSTFQTKVLSKQKFFPNKPLVLSYVLPAAVWEKIAIEESLTSFPTRSALSGRT